MVEEDIEENEEEEEKEETSEEDYGDEYIGGGALTNQPIMEYGSEARIPRTLKEIFSNYFFPVVHPLHDFSNYDRVDEMCSWIETQLLKISYLQKDMPNTIFTSVDMIALQKNSKARRGFWVNSLRPGGGVVRYTPPEESRPKRRSWLDILRGK